MNAAGIELLAEAQLEIDEAFDWYLLRSARAAQGLLRELDRAMSFIRTSPNACSPFEAGTRRLILTTYPYSLVFRQVGQRIEVLALAHHKRRPRYWIGR